MLITLKSFGWLEEKPVVLETLLSCKRAGTDAILMYYAREAAGWIDKPSY